MTSRSRNCRNYRKCLICGTREDLQLNYIQFHKFPKDPTRRAAWLQNLKVEVEVDTELLKKSHVRVCSQHFKKSFNRKDITQEQLAMNPTGSSLPKMQQTDAERDDATIVLPDTPPSPLTCYAVRLRPGQEIKSALQCFIARKHLQSAFILTCVGSVRRATLRLADSHTMLEVVKNHEIVSLVGTLSESGGCHLHASLSDEKGQVIGGHVMGNMEVFTTAEIVIGNLPSVKFSREMDEETSYKELKVSNALCVRVV